MKPQFLVHEERDSVGVAVTEIKAGEKMAGSYLEGGKQITLQSKDAIPLGHKVALKDIREGEDIVKYGVVIGKAKQAIKAGQHVHVHNIKSNRWQNVKI